MTAPGPIPGQADLLDFAATEAHARRTDPSTSRLAAGSVRVRESQRAVLALFVSGPATDEQLWDRTFSRSVRISPSGLRTRRSELVAVGLVRDTGRKERLSSGRMAIVWEACDV